MPPKPKFTREEIVAAALEIVSHKGVEALTARELGCALGSSPRPIFTVFKGMEELQQAVRQAAMARFEGRARESLPGVPVFKQVGMQMVLFGMQEPKLYQLLFMQENQPASGFDAVFAALGATADMCMATIQQDYGLTEAQARELFKRVWIFTFGIGAMCATGMCSFSPQQLGQMLTDQFQATMLQMQAERPEGNIPLETERLILREMTADDLHALYAVLGDAAIMQHYPAPFTKEQVEGWIATNQTRYEECGFGLWAVCLKETGQVIGDCGLTLQPINGRIRPEIGYHIAREHQRKGYAREAASACLGWCFTHTTFGMAYAYMPSSNTPSAATARSLGMGLVEAYTNENGRPTLVYGITKAAWQAKKEE